MFETSDTTSSGTAKENERNLHGQIKISYIAPNSDSSAIYDFRPRYAQHYKWHSFCSNQSQRY